ncbi:hypothetical protein ACFE04_001077 [Oxalis oulophora]
MHLWPSKTIRDSFKVDYLTTYERNLQRMKSDKFYNSLAQSPKTPPITPTIQQKLLLDTTPTLPNKPSKLARYVSVIFSYCFCCGGALAYLFRIHRYLVEGINQQFDSVLSNSILV